MTNEAERRDRLLQAFLLATPTVLWATDAEGKITDSEGGGLEAIGLQPGQLVGQSVFDVYAAAPDVIECHRRALTGEVVAYKTEVEGVCYECWLTPLSNERGEVTGTIGVGVGTDVSERERREAALRETEADIRSLLEGNADAIAVIADGKIVACNSAFVELARMPRERA